MCIDFEKSIYPYIFYCNVEVDSLSGLQVCESITSASRGIFFKALHSCRRQSLQKIWGIYFNGGCSKACIDNYEEAEHRLACKKTLREAQCDARQYDQRLSINSSVSCSKHLPGLCEGHLSARAFRENVMACALSTCDSSARRGNSRVFQ